MAKEEVQSKFFFDYTTTILCIAMGVFFIHFSYPFAMAILRLSDFLFFKQILDYEIKLDGQKIKEKQ